MGERGPLGPFGGRSTAPERRHPTPAVPDPTVEALSEAERVVLQGVFAGWSTMPGELVPAVERILATRAAAPDALRVALEALAAELNEAADDSSERLSDFEDGYSVAMTDAASMTRALLDDPALAGRATGGEG